jgi:hypothetical protein
MVDDFELNRDPIEPPAVPSEKARSEESVFSGAEPKENSVIIKLWGGGHLSFNPNNHTSIFSLIALMAVLLTCLIVSLIGILTSHDAVWLDKIATALGYGITGIIGAMVGSSAASKEKEK